MPVLLDGQPAPRGEGLVLGLVNNMPDAALQATERQFVELIERAAGDRAVRLRLFSMPTVARGAQGAAHVAAHYASTDTLGRHPLDALIVTGCEPRAASLRDEPFWDTLAGVVDWAAQNTVSTLWSCLAAHAAVLHLDGIARRRLPQKRSGLFDCETMTPHPLLAGAPARLAVPHSRWNDLAEDALEAHGYHILTRSPQAGVDLFVKEAGSLFVFFQGHPEYEVDSIAREYRRDVSRFLKGERADYPSMPQNYFDAATEAGFAEVRQRALADRTMVGLRDLPRQVAFRPGLAAGWQQSVLPVFDNWLSLIAEGCQARSIAA